MTVPEREAVALKIVEGIASLTDSREPASQCDAWGTCLALMEISKGLQDLIKAAPAQSTLQCGAMSVIIYAMADITEELSRTINDPILTNCYLLAHQKLRASLDDTASKAASIWIKSHIKYSF